MNNILERGYQYYLYNEHNELVHRTNSFDDAVKFKNEHQGVVINSYRR